MYVCREILYVYVCVYIYIYIYVHVAHYSYHIICVARGPRARQARYCVTIHYNISYHNNTHTTSMCICTYVYVCDR